MASWCCSSFDFIAEMGVYEGKISWLCLGLLYLYLAPVSVRLPHYYSEGREK